MKFQKNIPLKNYTTFKIGGRAQWFCVVKTKENLVEALKAAKNKKLPFFILGGGSNLLVSDKGYKGFVIKIKNEKLKVKNQNSKFQTFLVGAGLPLARLVAKTAEVGAAGLEWVSGIPGATVGGAIRGNAGAFGIEIKDVVAGVEVLDAKDFKIKKFKNKDCQFGYKNSIFKKNQNLIIFSAELKLKKESKKKVKEKIKEILSYRRKKHPQEPSAGSIFKNPSGFFSGQLIEGCGLKGKKIGGAKISEKHANFIINLGNARALDVLKLINLTKKKVKNKFKKNLEEEIKFLGKF